MFPRCDGCVNRHVTVVTTLHDTPMNAAGRKERAIKSALEQQPNKRASHRPSIRHLWESIDKEIDHETTVAHMRDRVRFERANVGRQSSRMLCRLRL
jgi:hypothetical protein